MKTEVDTMKLEFTDPERSGPPTQAKVRVVVFDSIFTRRNDKCEFVGDILEMKEAHVYSASLQSDECRDWQMFVLSSQPLTSEQVRPYLLAELHDVLSDLPEHYSRGGFCAEAFDKYGISDEEIDEMIGSRVAGRAK